MVGSIGNGAGVIQRVCELGVALGTRHVAKRNVVRHSRSKPGGESPNLLMDVVHEGVGGPTPMFLDGDAINAIEFHGHGPTSTQRMAADIGLVVAKPLKTKLGDGGLDFGVDVCSSDLLRLMEEVIVGAEGSGSVGCVLHDVGHSMCQSLDRAGCEAGAVVVDALTTSSILLVRDL